MSIAEAARRDRRDDWWRNAVVYQIYPRSFADANGDGIGDIQGIREHVDHLVALGVDAVWLSPFYPSPQVDAGYDVSDYFDLAPEYGSLQDLDALIADLHEAGIRVIIDDYAEKDRLRVWLKVILFAASAFVLLVGTLTIFAFDPCPSGAAANPLPSFCAAH